MRRRKPKHILVIESVYDGVAICTCKKWSHVYTGRVIIADVFLEWLKHKLDA